jgi:hypothetical protein
LREPLKKPFTTIGLAEWEWLKFKPQYHKNPPEGGGRLRADRVAQVVKHLPNRLSSNTRTTIKEKKANKKQELVI